MSDPIDDFLAAMGMPVNAANAPASEGGAAPAETDLFAGSEPVAAAPAAPAATPAPSAPAATAPAIVPDVTNVSIDSVLAELIRRVFIIETALRRQGMI